MTREERLEKRLDEAHRQVEAARRMEEHSGSYAATVRREKAEEIYAKLATEVFLPA